MSRTCWCWRKANSRSTVYRNKYLDYVGVKKLGRDGRVIGEWRFLGLYTHAAYTESIARIPVLRRKLADVLAAGRGHPGQPRRQRPHRDPGELSARGTVPDLHQPADRDRRGRAAPARAQADPAVPAPGRLRALHVLPGLPAPGPVHDRRPAAGPGDLAHRAARRLGGLQRDGRGVGAGPAALRRARRARPPGARRGRRGAGGRIVAAVRTWDEDLEEEALRDPRRAAGPAGPGPVRRGHPGQLQDRSDGPPTPSATSAASCCCANPGTRSPSSCATDDRRR